MPRIVEQVVLYGIGLNLGVTSPEYVHNIIKTGCKSGSKLTVLHLNVAS